MDNPRSLTVVVVDDVKKVCNLVADFIEHIEGIKVVGTANSIQEALECITNLEPDIVIQDVNMPSFGLLQNGIDVLRWIKEHYPATQVVMLSIHNDRIYRRTCEALGAYAYLDKVDRLQVLTETLIRLVAAQESS